MRSKTIKKYIKTLAVICTAFGIAGKFYCFRQFSAFSKMCPNLHILLLYSQGEGKIFSVFYSAKS